MNIFSKIASLCIFLLCSSSVIASKKSWREITTVEDVCSNYPSEVEQLFESLNLNLPYLAHVKSSYEEGNVAQACRALLSYYKTKKTHFNQTIPAIGNGTTSLGDSLLENVFVVQQVRGKVEFLENGHRDWFYRGPDNAAEWAWLSNRHPQIDSLLTIYSETGNPKYAIYIDDFLRDFIVASIPYTNRRSGHLIWRGLEVSFRAKVWPHVFYSLIKSKYLQPSTQLLLLTSLIHHAHYNRNFHAQGNWLTMEISGLANIAANFPEFKNSKEWLQYSISTMEKSMKEQVYPDGVQTELTSHYHKVALQNFVELKETCKLAGVEMPDYYNNTLYKMSEYLARTIRPSGYGLLNNDSDLMYNRDFILDKAEEYQHEDWKYWASNGEMGGLESNQTSFVYPWAGHVISRNNFEKDGHWLFFDIGPWGAGHEHYDKLHISIDAYGRSLLVDGGRFAYDGDMAKTFRSYAIGSQSHNVLLIDGKGQKAGAPLASQPVESDKWEFCESHDFATGSFGRFRAEGQVQHSRSVLYVKDGYWVVVDRITTDRPRKINALWHFHPDCKVVNEDNVVSTKNERGNLSIVPLGSYIKQLRFKKGEKNNSVQGWYSSEYNLYEPNTCCEYELQIKDDTTLVWLLVPSEKKSEKIKSKIVQIADDCITVNVKFKKQNKQLCIPYYSDNQLEVTTITR